MTQIDVLKMAIEAGLAAETPDGRHQIWYPDNLHYFANLVAAKEREACAQVCETFEIPKKILGAHPDYLEGKHMAVFQCAAAIRARGEQA